MLIFEYTTHQVIFWTWPETHAVPVCGERITGSRTSTLSTPLTDVAKATMKGKRNDNENLPNMADRESAAENSTKEFKTSSSFIYGYRCSLRSYIAEIINRGVERRPTG